MSSRTISRQVDVINSATKTAAKSKETALQFLRDAGIAKGSVSSKAGVTTSAQTPPKK